MHNPSLHLCATLGQTLLACGLIIAGHTSICAQLPPAEPAVLNPVANTSAALPNQELVALGRKDASLNDLAVVSEDRLVAVGDRGVMLISSNSGRSWEPLESPTTANLRGVRFSPLGFGLIVGGWIGNDTRASHAVVLRTLNGGKTWSVISTSDLPRLLGLRIQENHCIAWGDYSPQWRTSLFESLDGGLTWHGVQAPLGHAVAAGLSAAGELVAIDQLGRGVTGNLRQLNSSSRIAASASNAAGPDQPLLAVHHTGDRWLACGTGGELIASVDGNQWTDIDLPLSRAARELCQWQAIEQVGDHVWVCGRPGSIVLHSRDRGTSWSVLRTGQALPLSALRFVDQNRGWATGPLGLILATRDGGQTWYAQRQHARRLGLLAIGSDSRALPWAPLVAAAWDEQVAVAASIYQPLEPIEQAGFLPSQDDLRRDAAAQVGLADCRVTFRPAVSSVRFIEHASVELLSWRPDVLLISQPPKKGTGATADLAGSALAMLKLCAAPNALLSNELGLAPWNVSKLVGTCPGEAGHFTEQSARVLRQPGIAVWDCLLPLSSNDRQAAQTVAMRTLWAHSQSKSTFAALMGAIAPSPETERQVSIRNIGNYQLMMGRVHRAQSMQQMAEVPIVQKSLDQWSSDLDFVLRTVPAQESVPLLQRLTERLDLGLQWEKRRVVYQHLIDNSRHSDAADWGRLALLKLERSDERQAWQQSLRRSQKSELQLAGESTPPLPQDRTNSTSQSARVEPWNASPFGKTIGDQPAAVSPSMVVAASAELPLAHARIQSQPAVAPVAWQQLLHRTSLYSQAWLERPDVQLLLYRDQRQEDDDGPLVAEAMNQLQSLLNAQQLIGWPQMAAQELAVVTNTADQLRWQVSAWPASQPPVLDGALDDDCWNQSSPMRLTSLEEPQGQVQPPDDTLIRWSYDQEYLYIAILSPHVPGSPPPSAAHRRGYDADLSDTDHVQIVLDTDRDYCTAIELAVSADGRTYDRCCELSEYNPKWHVSVHSNIDYWTAELAIKLDELTLHTPLARRDWAVSARRLHPSGASQSWSQLRTHQPYLHASGLLRFSP